MSELIAVEFCSLDGVIQAPGRPDEDTSGGFTRGGWASVHLADDPEATAAAMGGQGDTRGMLFGHRTYLDLVGHWLGVSAPNPFTEVLRATPKFVASRRSDAPLPHPNSTLLHGEAVDTVRALKERTDGDLIMLGSASLLHALQEAGLVDGYVLTVVPVILGGGTRLFAASPAPAEMHLVRGVITSKGAYVAEYRRT
jgi:dihydrofolate reductase